MCVCAFACVFSKLHITAQSSPVMYSFYAIACNPPRGLLFMSIFLARNARASSHNSSPHYDGSRPEPHSLDINYNALPGEKMGTETREMVDRLVPFQHMGKPVARRVAQQIETGIRQTGSTPADSPCDNLASPTKAGNVLQQWCCHSAPFPFQHPIDACHDYTRTSFLST